VTTVQPSASAARQPSSGVATRGNGTGVRWTVVAGVVALVAVVVVGAFAGTAPAEGAVSTGG
jgi:hypothetical protein